MTNVESRVSVDAEELRTCSSAEALAFVDRVFGDATLWPTSLIAQRLAASFHEDWKAEVGCWLMVAEELGFLAALMKRCERAWNEAQDLTVAGPNDSAHRILWSELAPAMATYYFTRLGWRFVAWEPKVSKGDVDVRLRCPQGILTDIQVKAPDQPGQVVGGQIVDGEYDSRVLAQVDKAFAQLVSAPSQQRVAVLSPQRTWPVAAETYSSHLFGKTVATDRQVVLLKKDRGAFATSSGRGTGAVVDLSLLRGVDDTLYRSTVFINPWADTGRSPTRAAFPKARVCDMVDGKFVWHPEPPQHSFSLPNGTVYVDSEP